VSARLVLGVDGGGTKTQAIIMDEAGRVLGEGLGGPTNVDDHAPAIIAANLETAIRNARAQGGLGSQRFDAACLGLAGVVSEQEREIVIGLARDLRLAPPERILVDHDAAVALAGGLSGRPGLVLIAGTGSACFGINAEGERHLAGGWGHLLADEGSGYWLSMEGLRAAVRAFDGRGAATDLARLALSFLGIQTPTQIMHRLYIANPSRAELAAFAPTVLELAAAGDLVAWEIVARGAEALAEIVATAASRLRIVAPEVVQVGSVLNSEVMTKALRAQLVARLPGANLVLAERKPAYGACLLARKLLVAREQR
jgi:N-acetylglucosamine kinase-like BadF-type ATPase